MIPEIDVVTDPAFTADVSSRDMDELRAVRTRCQSIENSLSYVRRLIQGRLDIVGAELQRRTDGGADGSTPELIGRLPDILSESSRTSGGPGSVRPPQAMDPDEEVAAKLEVMVEAAIAADDLAAVASLDDQVIADAVGALTTLESSVSAARRELHGVIDVIQAEVTRRYKSGEASVDGLLGSRG